MTPSLGIALLVILWMLLKILYNLSTADRRAEERHSYHYGVSCAARNKADKYMRYNGYYEKD